MISFFFFCDIILIGDSMKQASIIISKLIELYNSSKSNSEKHSLGSKLWTEYYKTCKEHDIYSEEGYNLYLMLESESYIINQPPIRKYIDVEKLGSAIDHLKNVMDDSVIKDGISMDEAKLILDWTVENTRKNFEILGINIDNNSLNGFCEIGQALSIMPLEKLGLNVTKNTAKDSFGYSFHHCFGTVTFPIFENNDIKDRTFLIDTTYRQFFSTVRCNEGRYYTKEENTMLDTAPDPGYFVEDEIFARELMANGYTELDEITAEKYGKPFVLSSRTINMSKIIKNQEYMKNIYVTSSDYIVNDFDMEGLNIDIPTSKNNTNKYII